MAALTHPQARAFIQAAADQRLSASDAHNLHEHLRGCPECRAYSADINALSGALQRAWHTRWGANLNPSAGLLASVHQGWRSRPRARLGSFSFGLNRLGLVAGLLAVLVVTGVAAASIQSQPGGFGNLFGADAEPSVTVTHLIEASSTATRCQAACGDHTPEASATQCAEDCPTHAAEASTTHQPEASATPSNTHAPEASSTPSPTHHPEPRATASNTHVPEPSATPSSTHEPEATWTPSPTHHPEASATPTNTHAPEATWTPTPTHQPEPSATASSTHAPEPSATASNTHVPEPSATPSPTHAPEQTATPTPTQI